jgi:hypothetical protein
LWFTNFGQFLSGWRVTQTLGEKSRLAPITRSHLAAHGRPVTLGIIQGEWFPSWRVDYRYLHDSAAKAQNEVEVGVYFVPAAELCDFDDLKN